MKRTLLFLLVLFGGLFLLNSVAHLYLSAEKSETFPQYKGHTLSKGYSKDHQRYYKNSPNHRSYFWHPDLNIRVLKRVNNFECLGPNINQEKEEKILRVAVIGDSFVENIGMAEEYRYTAVLQEMLQKIYLDRQVEVLNLGVVGYGPGQEFLIYQDVVKKLKPDIVICVHYQNDMSDLYQNQIFELKGNKLINNRNLFNSEGYLATWLNDLALSRFVVDRILFKKLDTQFTPETLRTYELLMRRFKEEIEKQESTFLSVIASNLSFGDATQRQELIDYQLKLISIHKKLNIPTLDLELLWEKQKIPMQNLFFYYDRHWNEKGNHQAALDTANFILKIRKTPSQLTLKDWPYPKIVEYDQIPRGHLNIPHSYNKVSAYLANKLINRIGPYLLSDLFHVAEFCDFSTDLFPEGENGFALKLLVKEWHSADEFDPRNLLENFGLRAQKIDIYSEKKFHDLFSESKKIFFPTGFQFSDSTQNITFDFFWGKKLSESGDVFGFVYVHPHLSTEIKQSPHKKSFLPISPPIPKWIMAEIKNQGYQIDCVAPGMRGGSRSLKVYLSQEEELSASHDVNQIALLARRISAICLKNENIEDVSDVRISLLNSGDYDPERVDQIKQIITDGNVWQVYTFAGWYRQGYSFGD